MQTNNTSDISSNNDNTYEYLQAKLNTTDHYYLRIMSLEIYALQLDLKNKNSYPNAIKDPIVMISFSIYETLSTNSLHNHQDNIICSYILIVTNLKNKKLSYKTAIHQSNTKHQIYYSYYDNEIDLLYAFAIYMQEFDPDIIIGYEIQQLSLGYILYRSMILKLKNYINLLARNQANNLFYLHNQKKVIIKIKMIYFYVIYHLKVIILS